MSALTAFRPDILNKARLGRKIGRPAKSGFTFYNGALVVVDATGYLKPNTGVAGEKVVGICDLKNHPTVVTTGSDGATVIDVIDGIFPFKIGASADALAQADVQNVVYGIDDQTVGKTDGGTRRPRVGQLVSIETVAGVTQALVSIGTEWMLATSQGGTTDAVSAAGAISPTTDITELAVSGTMAFTLANGAFIGQRKVVATITAAATPVATLTAATSHGWTTVSGLGAVARSVELAWTALGWDLVGGVGITAA